MTSTRMAHFKHQAAELLRYYKRHGLVIAIEPGRRFTNTQRLQHELEDSIAELLEEAFLDGAGEGEPVDEEPSD